MLLLTSLPSDTSNALQCPPLRSSNVQGVDSYTRSQVHLQGRFLELCCLSPCRLPLSSWPRVLVTAQLEELRGTI